MLTESSAQETPRWERARKKIPKMVPKYKPILPAYSKSRGSRNRYTPGAFNHAAPGGANEAKLVKTPLSGSCLFDSSSCAESIVVIRSCPGYRELQPCIAT